MLIREIRVSPTTLPEQRSWAGLPHHPTRTAKLTGSGIHALLVSLLLAATLLLSSCDNQEQDTKLVFTSNLIIQADNLNTLLGTTPLSIIDVRPEADFLAGHIPGAVNIWRPQMADTTYAWTSITAPRTQLEKYFGSLGLRPTDPVVIYDHNKLTDASNLLWIFQLYGRKEAGILEGGFVAWQRAGYPTEEGPSIHPPTQFTFAPADDSSAYAGLATMQQAISDPATLIVDVRTWDEYTGKDVREGALRGGRIPRSIWFDYKQLLTEKNGASFFRPKEEMITLLKSKGITPDKKVVCYCQSGVRSANFACILNRVLGYNDVRNYDGSWEEWSSHPNLPFEQGEPAAPSLTP